MRTRDDVLVYQEVQSADKSSKTINLKEVDPISALAFEFEATNGSTSNVQNPFPYCITKIEVVDGGDTLCSLSFPEAQALQWYKSGQQPELREDEPGGGTQVIGCMILFGRYLWDQDFALDLTKLKNPQLRITWDLTVTRAIDASSAFATGTFKISVWAKVMESLAAAPSKFLTAQEIESWTGATSGDHDTELPTNLVYHMIMLRAYLRAVNNVYDVNECVTELKLSADSNKFVAFDRFTKQLRAEMAQLFGAVNVWKRFFAKNTDNLWFEVNLEPQLNLMTTVLNHLASYSWCWSGAAYLLLGDTAGAAIGSAERVDGMISGTGLHHTIPIPMGIMNDPNTWFDPTAYGSLNLISTQGAASANAVVIEQVRPN